MMLRACRHALFSFPASALPASALAKDSLLSLIQCFFHARKFHIPPLQRFSIDISCVLSCAEASRQWSIEVLVEEKRRLFRDISGIGVANGDGHMHLRRVHDVQSILLQHVVSLFLDELPEHGVP